MKYWAVIAQRSIPDDMTERPGRGSGLATPLNRPSDAPFS